MLYKYICINIISSMKYLGVSSLVRLDCVNLLLYTEAEVLTLKQTEHFVYIDFE